MKQVPDRNAQFENIARLRAAYEAAGNPIISLDTKKKLTITMSSPFHKGEE